MTAAALALAIVGALLAVAIHATMPTFILMAVRVAVSELSAYVILLAALGLALAVLAPKDGTRVAAIALAIVAIVLAAVPLAQASAAIKGADSSLDAIGAPPGTEPPFSVARLFTRLPTPEVKRTNDVPFRTIGATTLRLDRYDGTGSGPHPALVVIHGGSWRNGDKGEGSTDPTVTNRIFAGMGITVYDIEYRLVPTATVPAQLEDVLCALGHVRARAAEDNVDPERVAILGRSAGAHLALLAAYRAGRDPVPDGCGRPATVRGVISLYGPTDLAHDYLVPSDPDLINGSAAIADFLGGTPDTAPALYALATPQRSVDRPVPPTLLIHGLADQIVKPFNSEALAAALSQGGNAVALVELPWAGHGFDAVSWGLGSQIALSAMERFLALTLQPGVGAR